MDYIEILYLLASDTKRILSSASDSFINLKLVFLKKSGLLIRITLLRKQSGHKKPQLT